MSSTAPASGEGSPLDAGFKSSSTFRLLSWQDTAMSAFLFVTGVALYLSFCLFEYPFPSIFTHLATLALLFSGLVAAVAALGLRARLPPAVATVLSAPPQLPANGDQIRAVVAALGERYIAAVVRANALLRWTRPEESGRALAYAWLCAHYAFLLSPGWLLFFWVAGFALVPAYTFFQRDIDAAVAGKVLPKVEAARGLYGLLAGRARGVLRANAAVPIVAATVLCAFLYIFWDWWSFGGLATLASLAVMASDGMSALSGERKAD